MFMPADRGNTNYICVSCKRDYSLHLRMLTEGIEIKYVSDERVHYLRHLTECRLYLYELIEVTHLI